MSNGLLTFGLGWMCVSALLGLYLGIKHLGMSARLDAFAQNGSLADYHREYIGFRERVTVHAHGFLFSTVCIGIALALPKMAYPAWAISALALLLMAATVVWSLGAFARIRPLMGLGDFMFLGALVGAALGMARTLL